MLIPVGVCMCTCRQMCTCVLMCAEARDQGQASTLISHWLARLVPGTGLSLPPQH